MASLNNYCESINQGTEAVNEEIFCPQALLLNTIFQIASSKGVKMIKFISKFALPVTLLAGLYLMISGNLFSLNLFLVLQVLAVITMFWARHSFQPGQFNIHEEPKEGSMISSGPYKLIRHPMYASALVIIWSGILGHFSPVNFVIAVIVTVVVSIRIITEEQYLSEHYPAYVDYSCKTKSIIPFII